jgi:hypothetical protein
MFTVKRKLFYDRHCDTTNYRFCIGEDDIASFKVDDGRFEKVGMRVSPWLDRRDRYTYEMTERTTESGSVSQQGANKVRLILLSWVCSEKQNSQLVL